MLGNSAPPQATLAARMNVGPMSLVRFFDRQEIRGLVAQRVRNEAMQGTSLVGAGTVRHLLMRMRAAIPGSEPEAGQP